MSDLPPEQLSSLISIRTTIVVPVPETSVTVEYLPAFLASVSRLEGDAFEVVLVVDGNGGDAASVAENFARENSCARIIPTTHEGLGGMRNTGLEHARGSYVFFADAAGELASNFMEILVSQADSFEADIVLFDWYEMREDGDAVKGQPSVRARSFGRSAHTFHWRDLADHVMQVTKSVPWNKFYRVDFLRAINLVFDENPDVDDFGFSARSLASATCIAYAQKNLYTQTYSHAYVFGDDSDDAQALASFAKMVSSALSGMHKMSNFLQVRFSAIRTVVDAVVEAFRSYTGDWNELGAQKFYERCQNLFRDHEQIRELRLDELNNDMSYSVYRILHDVELSDFLARLSEERIASFTSFPARIGTVHRTVATLLAQTLPADRICLNLAESEFPHREEDLPPELRSYIDAGQLEIRWGENLRSHKKYAYVMRDNPHANIMLFDDDIEYDSEVMEALVYAHVLQPNAICAVWALAMGFDEFSGELLPLKEWLGAYDARLLEPSLQLWVLSGAGSLYPAGCFLNWLEQDGIVENMVKLSPYSDEVCLRAMSLANEIPVVVSRQFAGYDKIEEAQDFTLWSANGKGEKDAAIGRVFSWYSDMTNKDLYAVAREGVQGMYRVSRTEVFGRRLKEARLDIARLEKTVKTLEPRVSSLVQGVVDIPLTAPVDWSQPEDVFVEVEAKASDFNSGRILKALPGKSYKVQLEFVEGSASSFTVQLHERISASVSHRMLVRSGKPVTLCFQVAEGMRPVQLLVYPREIGRTAGQSVTVKASIQSAGGPTKPQESVSRIMKGVDTQMRERIAELEERLNRFMQGVRDLTNSDDIEWAQEECVVLEIPARNVASNPRMLLAAHSGNAYRIHMERMGGSADTFDVQLYSRAQGTFSHRVKVASGEQYTFAFAVASDCEELEVLVYPNGIGESFGESVSVKAIIATDDAGDFLEGSQAIMLEDFSIPGHILITDKNSDYEDLPDMGVEFEWEEISSQEISIEPGDSPFKSRSIMTAVPGEVYRVILEQTGGSVQSFGVRLYARESRMDSHRTQCLQGNVYMLCFYAPEDAEEMTLFAYPKAVGKATGESLTLEATVEKVKNYRI